MLESIKSNSIEIDEDIVSYLYSLISVKSGEVSEASVIHPKESYKVVSKESFFDFLSILVHWFPN